MKKIIRLLVLAVVLVATLCCLSACKTWKDTYVQLAEEGYDVIVRYDTTDGKVANIQGTVIKDVYSTVGRELNRDGTVDIKLYAPDDKIRGVDGKGNPKIKITKDDHTFIGWYTNRELRTDANGNPLDEYGQLCSETGREQGYIYSGFWNFENDTLKVDPNNKTPDGEYTLTLYAAWAPKVTYEIYYEFVDYGVSGEFGGSDTPYLSVQKLQLTIPKWNDSGKMKIGHFPTYTNIDLTELEWIVGSYYTAPEYDANGNLKEPSKFVENDDSDYALGFALSEKIGKNDIPMNSKIIIADGYELVIIGRKNGQSTYSYKKATSSEIKLDDSFWDEDDYKEFLVFRTDHTSENPLTFKNVQEITAGLEIQAPFLDGDTFYAASLSPNFETELVQGQAVPGSVDEATGTLSLDGDTVKVYTRWLKGTWYKITNKRILEQNAKTSDANSNYIILKDIDFGGKALPAAFSSVEFNGQIIGNGHKFHNISATQVGEQGGLFYGIGKDAEIKDLTIENATYTMGTGATKMGNNYGLLAGKISAEATFENVSILDSKLVITSKLSNPDNNIGLLCGNIVNTGIDIIGISLEVLNDENDLHIVEAEADYSYPNGHVVITVTEKPQNNDQ